MNSPSPVKGLISLFTNLKWFRKVLEIGVHGYLIESGWKNSFLAQEPLSSDNEPEPWFSIEANIFVKNRLSSALSIFEYGSGNSSIYFSKTCKSVHSVEHNAEWHSKISGALKAYKNIELELKKDAEDYQNAITNTGKTFDLVIVDGILRNECAAIAFHSLSENGILVLDDSERTEYQPTFELAKKLGYKELSVYGMAVGVNLLKSTTFFYRSNNVFNI